MLLETQFYRQNEAILQPLIDYFEDTWIGRPTANGIRRAPRYPITNWNCYTSVIDELPKTNNSVEGWHRAFSSLISCQHPSIWKFISGIKKDQSLNEFKLEQYVAGTPVKQNYERQLQAVRFQSIVNKYGERDTIDYLRGIAHNITYPTD
ncbi:uncharacterized protein B4U80_11049 [Leptotrombidium deliense]|uniref:MULE transposase domain-containing protein n=1 Tax=Leptotrombidium deliense TaxID=299467 RepID=A0A443RY78_9ACAR|nr:uncharacterized protein B4U80_11049 [Leptotrombidium deliense]